MSWSLTLFEENAVALFGGVVSTHPQQLQSVSTFLLRYLYTECMFMCNIKTYIYISVKTSSVVLKSSYSFSCSTTLTRIHCLHISDEKVEGAPVIERQASRADTGHIGKTASLTKCYFWCMTVQRWWMLHESLGAVLNARYKTQWIYAWYTKMLCALTVKGTISETAYLTHAPFDKMSAFICIMCVICVASFALDYSLHSCCHCFYVLFNNLFRYWVLNSL